jgi:hypothetical protein
VVLEADTRPPLQLAPRRAAVENADTRRPMTRLPSWATTSPRRSARGTPLQLAGRPTSWLLAARTADSVADIRPTGHETHLDDSVRRMPRKEHRRASEDGHAQITAEIGLAAQQANPSQFPSSARPTAGIGRLTQDQTASDAQITAKPGPAAQNAAQQSAFFPVSDLPRT